MIRLSIIVPALGTQPEIDDTLVSVLENRPAGCEIIVPKSKGYRDPYQLDDEVRFVEGEGAAGLAGLINAGIAASTAPYVHWLVPGTTATPDWAEPVIRQFDTRLSVLAVAPLVLSRDDPGRIQAAGINYKIGGARQIVGRNRRYRSCKRLAAQGPPLLGGFCRRSTFLELGLFRGCMGDFFADADFAARLHLAGGHCAVNTDCKLLGGKPLAAESQLAHGRKAERLFWSHAKPYRLARSVPRHILRLSLQSLAVLFRPSAARSGLGRAVGAFDSVFNSEVRRGPQWPSAEHGGRETDSRQRAA